jgi:hypothetical protein
MALQPFVGPWPLLQFVMFFYTNGRIPWTGNQPVARPVPTQRTAKHRNSTHTHKEPCFLVGFKPTIPAFERAKTCLRPRGHNDRSEIFLPLSVCYYHPPPPLGCCPYLRPRSVECSDNSGNWRGFGRKR